MTKTDKRLLEALRCFLTGSGVDWPEEISAAEWRALFHQAQKQHIMPMIYEAVFRCPAFQTLGRDLAPALRRETLQMFYLQSAKTAEFLTLYQALRAADVTPLVVKGLICRSLYPQPELRVSGDEDLLIPRADFLKCHDLLLQGGMTPANPEEKILEVYEVPYRKREGALYIELHKELFPHDSEAYGDLNRFFDRAFDRSVEVVFQGVQVRTMCPTDHLFYLICHAFKHFLHSGFGIRQVCDIALYANAWGREIDWPQVMEQCKAIRADSFAAALFRIGRRYLTLSPAQAALPAQWAQSQVDETALLEDLLSGGVYGGANASRLHSSTITLNAVAEQKKGKKAGASILKSVFPPRKNLEGRYPMLKKYPVLLPCAWVDRLAKYHAETRRGSRQNAAAESIRIGQQRVELLKQYGIIEP